MTIASGGDETRLLLTSDLHGHWPFYHALADKANQYQADEILCAGDLLLRVLPEEFLMKRQVQAQFQGSLDAWLPSLARPFHYIWGNSDENDTDLITGTNLERTPANVGGITLMGFPYVLAPDYPTNRSLTEPEMMQFLERQYEERQLAGRPFAIVSHTPPLGIFDENLSGRHIGSRSLRAFIERTQPVFCQVGHVHHHFGYETLGQTLVVNGAAWHEKGIWRGALLTIRAGTIAGLTLIQSEGPHGQLRFVPPVPV